MADEPVGDVEALARWLYVTADRSGQPERERAWDTPTIPDSMKRLEPGWTPMEQALVMTLIDWKCDSDMRPSSGEGSDCSDLMDAALARLLGLASGDLTPGQVLDSIEEGSSDGR